jgi:hypothetical protein
MAARCCYRLSATVVQPLILTHAATLPGGSQARLDVRFAMIRESMGAPYARGLR